MLPRSIQVYEAAGAFLERRRFGPIFQVDPAANQAPGGPDGSQGDPGGSGGGGNGFSPLGAAVMAMAMGGGIVSSGSIDSRAYPKASTSGVFGDVFGQVFGQVF